MRRASHLIKYRLVRTVVEICRFHGKFASRTTYRATAQCEVTFPRKDCNTFGRLFNSIFQCWLYVTVFDTCFLFNRGEARKTF
jgi:hypothetical protein